MLFIGRFVQAFGASTGSVTTQTILRDNYHGNDRHHLFAKISAALAFFTGNWAINWWIYRTYYGFRVVFLFYVVMGMILLFWSLKRLPETKTANATPFSVQKMVVIGKK